MSDATQHDTPRTTSFPATCGHEDMLGYLVGQPCWTCTRKAHRQVTHPSLTQRRRTK